MKNTIISLIFLILCSCTFGVDTSSDVPLDETVRALMNEAIKDSFNTVSGGSIAIIADTVHIEVASGFDSTTEENLLSKTQPYRIASVTKTYVAAAILRLHEMDSLSIEDPISKYISENHIALLKKDDYNPSTIKIKHCLNHTNGLYDYALGGKTYLEKVRNNPTKKWSRTEQIEKAILWGTKIGEPGEHYYYSDTGYILLGEIIEGFFENRSLGTALRLLLKYRENELRETWLEDIELKPVHIQEKLVHRYDGKIDATNWDASIDLYGGGGIVATSHNVARFYHCLFNNEVFDNPKTLDLMLAASFPNAINEQRINKHFKDYRYGLWKVELFEEKAFMHTGFWGITAIHIPKYNWTIVTNFTSGNSERMIKKTVLALKNNLKASQ